MRLYDELNHYLSLGLTLVPLKFRSKRSLVRWGNGWNPSIEQLQPYFTHPANVGVLCGERLAVIDCDSEDAFRNFIAEHGLPPGCPVVKTARGYHIWMKPKKPIRSQRVGSLEIKCLGSYIVAPPSIHPSGMSYVFQVRPNGTIPEVDLEGLFSLPSDNAGSSGKNPTNLNAPSDFALRYGKSPYPQSLCGRATKILTRSDGKVKHLLSLRCWKWDCPKCASLLKRYWLEKLKNVPFRFILGLPTVEKPTAFLRRIGKPGYVHIVANGESRLFLVGGDAEKVWMEARRGGYDLIAGDISGDPTPDEVQNCLEQALCCEHEPLNTRRKPTHSRGLFRRPAQDNNDDESKRTGDCRQESGNMNGSEEKESPSWDTEVLMEPIEEVARELEAQGWRILWKSEVEAIAIRGNASDNRHLDIVELMGNLGVKLKKTGKEYSGLCPFHDDRDPSLSVNREKGLWYCFGCGRGGDVHKFTEEWKALRG